MNKKIKHVFRAILFWILCRIAPKQYCALRFRLAKGHPLDWNHPKDIDEKIQWLKFYGDTSKWPMLADKYAVREYVREKGLEEYLIPLIGKWDSAEKVDWNSMPKKFVMKTNHASGDALICNDKSKLDTVYWTEYFNKILGKSFGKSLAEYHYDKIRPCLIAEIMLDASLQSAPSTSLIDYKIWCFDGKPAFIFNCYNRTKESCNVGIYDTHWNFHPEYIVPNNHYILVDKPLPKPALLNEMLRVASILTKGFPIVRCDLYEVDGHVYFGEMTMTPSSGLNYFHPQSFLDILGDLCKIQ